MELVSDINNNAANTILSGITKLFSIEIDWDNDPKEELKSIFEDALSSKDNNENAFLVYLALEDFFVPKNESLIVKENLPAPQYLTDSPPRMPNDIVATSDIEIRQLQSKFNLYLNRTNWLVNQIENELRLKKSNYKSYYNKRLLSINPFYESAGKTKKEKRVAVIDAEALQDKEIINFQNEIDELENDLNTLKTLSNIYENNCIRLSREWTMRYSTPER